MSNGEQCCALEICCSPLRANGEESRLLRAMSKHSGASEEACSGFLAWMQHEGLVFAPESMRQVIQDIVAMTRKHEADIHKAD